MSSVGSALIIRHMHTICEVASAFAADARIRPTVASGLAVLGNIVPKVAKIHAMLRVLLLAALSVASALQFGLPASAISRSAVSMNTKYTTLYGLAKKKDPNSGRSSSLKGYTVGSLAPSIAVKSGTTIRDVGTTYGVSRRSGGKVSVAAEKGYVADWAVAEGFKEGDKGSQAAVVFSALSVITLLFTTVPK